MNRPEPYWNHIVFKYTHNCGQPYSQLQLLVIIWLQYHWSQKCIIDTSTWVYIHATKSKTTQVPEATHALALDSQNQIFLKCNCHLPAPLGEKCNSQQEVSVWYLYEKGTQKAYSIQIFKYICHWNK